VQGYEGIGRFMKYDSGSGCMVEVAMVEVAMVEAGRMVEAGWWRRC